MRVYLFLFFTSMKPNHSIVYIFSSWKFKFSNASMVILQTIIFLITQKKVKTTIVLGEQSNDKLNVISENDIHLSRGQKFMQTLDINHFDLRIAATVFILNSICTVKKFCLI